MLATPAERPIEGEHWVYERKLDGIRLIAVRNRETVRLFTRNGHDRSAAYPEVVEALVGQRPGQPDAFPHRLGGVGHGRRAQQGDDPHGFQGVAQHPVQRRARRHLPRLVGFEVGVRRPDQRPRGLQRPARLDLDPGGDVRLHRLVGGRGEG